VTIEIDMDDQAGLWIATKDDEVISGSDCVTQLQADMQEAFPDGSVSLSDGASLVALMERDFAIAAANGQLNWEDTHCRRS
jgi:hypothetical protein